MSQIPTSGSISLSQIGAEFSKINPIPLAYFYNADLGVPKNIGPAGPITPLPEISFSDFYGTRSIFVYTWNPSGTGDTYQGLSVKSVAVDDFDILQAANSAGWNGYTELLFNIPNNIMAYATSTGNPAMKIDYTSSSYTPSGYGKRWPRTITIDNQGWLMGKGGNGAQSQANGQAGGGVIEIVGTTPVVGVGDQGNKFGADPENEANDGNAGGTGLVIIQNTKAILAGGGGGRGGGGVGGGGGGGAGGGAGGRKGSAGGGNGGAPFKSGSNGGAVNTDAIRGKGGQAGGGGGGYDNRGKSSDTWGGGGGGGRVPAKTATGGAGGTYNNSARAGTGGSYNAKGGNGTYAGGGGGYGKAGGLAGGSAAAGGYAIKVVSGTAQYKPVGVNFQLEGARIGI